jgi:hypothetical protein
LAQTGIAEGEWAGASVFLEHAKDGRIGLDWRSVVVIDELGDSKPNHWLLLSDRSLGMTVRGRRRVA